MTTQMWSRVQDPKEKCTSCLEDQRIARAFGRRRLPKVRVGVWQIQLTSTGQLAAFCGDCKTNRRHRSSR